MPLRINVFGICDAFGNPLAAFESRSMMSRVSGGPEDVEIPLDIIPLELRRGRIHGQFTASGGEVSGLTEARLCGAVPLSTFALLPNLLDFIGGGMSAPTCDGSDVPATMADLLSDCLVRLVQPPVQKPHLTHASLSIAPQILRPSRCLREFAQTQCTA